MPINFDLSKYHNDIFIETGTLHGGGIDKAIECGFHKIISIEISDKLYHDAKLKYAGLIKEGRIILVHGDSAKELPRVIHDINEQCTFWLDAHKDNSYVKHMDIKCPLYEELEIVGKHHVKTHTVIIDDIRLFGAVDTWAEKINETVVAVKMKKINSSYKVAFEDGYINKDVLIFFV